GLLEPAPRIQDSAKRWIRITMAKLISPSFGRAIMFGMSIRARADSHSSNLVSLIRIFRHRATTTETAKAIFRYGETPTASGIDTTALIMHSLRFSLAQPATNLWRVTTTATE